MKYFLSLILFAGITVSTVAQNTKQTEQKPATTQTQQEQRQINPFTQHYARKYALAIQWNDYEVAKNALYDLIIENPANDSLLYTLAYYYYENQQYAPSLLIGQELLARKPKNLGYLEIAAASGEALGVADKALQNYETIYLLTNNINTLYKIAFLQFDLKRYNESLTNVDILLSKPDVSTLKVYYNDAENKSKEYLMKVAVLNLKGLILLEQGNKPGAKKLFDEALALAPDFVLAKQNLAKTK
jgi:tetratricopeptide (TPR) repeat protein